MDSKALAALLSPLISELILLLFLIFPSSNPLSITDSNSDSNSNSNSVQALLPQIIHFLSTADIATTLFLSKKRKRVQYTEPHDDEEEEDAVGDPGSRRLRRVNSDVPRNPDSFKLQFKMSASTFEWLSALLEPLLECRDPVKSPLNLPAETRLGIGLFRLATGSDYSDISTRFGVSEPTAKFCVKQLCRVLCTNFRFWVGFPAQKELESVSNSIQTLTGLPNCCGIIDCTRFKTRSKSQEESIAAQIVVDSSSRILSIIAGFNGNKSNSLILKSSSLYKDIEGSHLLNSQHVYLDGVSIPQYLIGDEGYTLLPWLLVPFSHPLANSSKENYNSALNLMRISARRTVASLKSWGVLSRQIDAEFKTSVAYIGACSILHNALLMREDYSALCDESDDSLVNDESSRSQYNRDTSMDDNLVEKKASEIRSALATRARNQSKDQ